jgi:hypothetical protein
MAEANAVSDVVSGSVWPAMPKAIGHRGQKVLVNGPATSAIENPCQSAHCRLALAVVTAWAMSRLEPR